MSKNTFIDELNKVGQSIWYDNLSLEVLRSGELKDLVSKGVSGLTSNPTIFKMAIADTDHYDDKIKRLAKNNLSTDDMVEELMIEDIGAAADLLLETFTKTAGHDGYASIEVSPHLANDTAGTIEAAKRIWGKLNRPNIMIKIPATEEGIPAIEETLKAGINVNITLIFSLEFYKKVVAAYISALKSITSEDTIKSIASVASFFVSRVDAKVEKYLASHSEISDEVKAKLIGKVGIANSKVAYDHFLSELRGTPFSELREKGAKVQRPLWASTGTKNPEFPDLLYVEALAGKDTVNTLPPKTLNALLSHAAIAANVETGHDEATATLTLLDEVGIPFEDMLRELQRDGVQSFKDSYDELTAAVEEKKVKIAA